MAKFNKQISIEADSDEKATKAAQAAINIYKAAMKVITLDEFIQFSNKITSNPEVIKTAKNYL